jgi:broad specificity phosphatase PhoE
LWELDPAHLGEVHALRSRVPDGAVWYSSPEPKAIATALFLTDGPVRIVPDLREQERRTTDWVDDFEGVVQQAFARPEESAYAGWEPLVVTRRRVVAAATAILDRHGDDEGVVLVGHGTAWTLLRAALLHEEPDVAWWSHLGMPDLWVVPPATGSATGSATDPATDSA